MPKLTLTLDEPVSSELRKLARAWGTSPEDVLTRLLPARGETVPPGGLCDLTRRELQVLDLMVAGEKNTGIARLLCLSDKTVKNHVHNILGKLKVNGRTQAAVLTTKLRGAGLDPGGNGGRVS